MSVSRNSNLILVLSEWYFQQETATPGKQKLKAS